MQEPLLTDDSGYCATQLSLSHPDEFNSLALVYPLIDIDDGIFTTGPLSDEPNVLRFPDKDILSKEETLAWIEKARQTPASRAGFERTPFAVSACQNGFFASHLLDPEGLNKDEFRPLNRIEAGAKLSRSM